MATAITTNQLVKTYRSGLLFGTKVHALKGIDLEVPEGGIFGLLGPNGAGKTTLIKTLLGIVRPSSGKAFVFGKPHSRQSTREQIGYLPENFQVARHHTGLSALFFLGRLSRLADSEIRKRVPSLLELVGLKGRENELVRNYSKGMKQRLGLAQALLHEPKLVFLDEPTDGLDPVGRHHVRQVIERMRDEGKTVFLNSHILQEVELICDRFAIMSKGNVAASGSLDDLLSNASEANTHTSIDVSGTQSNVDQAVSQLSQRLNISLQMVAPKTQPTAQASDEATVAEVAAEDFSTNDTLGSVDRPLHRIVMQSVQQEQIDKVVDMLRQYQVSIVHLAIHRPRLEQIFMQLVQDPQTTTSNTAAL